ncbi:MAG: hypothetical protein UU48_C0006G0066 [Candidatus Uhrbacteria bacterium GW2011_GWF2_41_16]|uniref:Uncharacterized protein n=2 Tax=Candidatus Uhriibacteriota TaxID=1752732 RepID=A0A0G0VEB5_9BACT|nr:MAG: hypothetical protein UU35_C0007G0067 [Candidatus Uhrbacteria bacterium GW2011_GWC2_41_11]KKR98026.1 MAG: hypothetical protein UU48_C0006G0066 [Candidatus Uhrbacteria bacterium GW2011_GWF2_41_16]
MVGFQAVSVLPVLAGTAGVGDIIKCSDFSSVYYLAEDGNRYAFPNENIYRSWYTDFSEVKTVSCSDLASLRLVGLVPYREGLRLIKITSAPTVYAVEPEGYLRALKDETQAALLYGEDWNALVDDLPDVFFGTYEVGKPLSDGEIPEGFLVSDAEENIFRIGTDGKALEIDSLFTFGQGETLQGAAQSLDVLEARLEKTLELIRVVGMPDGDTQTELDALIEVIPFDEKEGENVVPTSFDEIETEEEENEPAEEDTQNKDEESVTSSNDEVEDLLSDLDELVKEAEDSVNDLEQLSEQNQTLEEEETSV